MRTLADRVNWYFRAHGHSLSSSLHGIAKLADKEGLTKLCDEALGTRIDFSYLIGELKKAEDIFAHLEVIKGHYESFERVARELGSSLSDQEGLYQLFEKGKTYIQKLEQIVTNPQYRENEHILNLINSAIGSVHEFSQRQPEIYLSLAENGNERPEIFCFGQDIELLFYNILSNAGQAMSTTGGDVRIYIDHHPELGYVSVTIDSDSYISPRNLRKIRQRVPFTTKTNGHGQGMQIIYDVIDEYGGRLKVRSTKSSKTTFVIDIPYNRDVASVRN